MKKNGLVICTLDRHHLIKVSIFSKKNIDLLRLNMSHIEPHELEKRSDTLKNIQTLRLY